jgi:hypothetical protein
MEMKADRERGTGRKTDKSADRRNGGQEKREIQADRERSRHKKKHRRPEAKKIPGIFCWQENLLLYVGYFKGHHSAVLSSWPNLRQNAFPL